MLQKVLKFANYAVAVLVFCSNFAQNYPSTIHQGLNGILESHSTAREFEISRRI